MDPQDPDGAMVGSVSVDDPNPSTFTYLVQFSGDPAGTCTSHANAASLTIDALVLDSDHEDGRRVRGRRPHGGQHRDAVCHPHL